MVNGRRRATNPRCIIPKSIKKYFTHLGTQGDKHVEIGHMACLGQGEHKRHLVRPRERPALVGQTDVLCERRVVVVVDGVRAVGAAAMDRGRCVVNFVTGYATADTAFNSVITDTITVSDTADTVARSDAADNVIGAAAADTASGSTTADTVTGSNTADTVTGSTSADTVTGSTATDTIVDTVSVVNTVTGFASTDTVTDSATVTDTLTGFITADTVLGSDAVVRTGGDGALHPERGGIDGGSRAVQVRQHASVRIEIFPVRHRKGVVP